MLETRSWSLPFENSTGLKAFTVLYQTPPHKVQLCRRIIGSDVAGELHCWVGGTQRQIYVREITEVIGWVDGWAGGEKHILG